MLRRADASGPGQGVKQHPAAHALLALQRHGGEWNGQVLPQLLQLLRSPPQRAWRGSASPWPGSWPHRADAAPPPSSPAPAAGPPPCGPGWDTPPSAPGPAPWGPPPAPDGRGQAACRSSRFSRRDRPHSSTTGFSNPLERWMDMMDTPPPSRPGAGQGQSPGLAQPLQAQQELEERPAPRLLQTAPPGHRG